MWILNLVEVKILCHFNCNLLQIVQLFITVPVVTGTQTVLAI